MAGSNNQINKVTKYFIRYVLTKIWILFLNLYRYKDMVIRSVVYFKRRKNIEKVHNDGCYFGN